MLAGIILTFVQGLYELWGEGGTWEELQASVEAFPESRKAPWQTADKTYKAGRV